MAAVQFSKTNLAKDPSLKFYYSLDDNVLDASPNAYNGTLTGTSSYKTGIFNNTVAFTSNATYVDIPTGATLAEQSNSTVLFWWKRNGTPATYAEIWAERATSGTACVFYVTVGSDGKVFSRYRNDAGTLGTICQGATDICDNANHLVAAVTEADVCSIYIDGVLDSTQPAKVANPITAQSIRIGSDYQDATPLIDSNAIADEVLGLTRAISTTELLQLVAGTYPAGSFFM